MNANVLRLCEEADFGELNCQYTTKIDARQNVQLTTEPAFLQNRCYRFVLLFCRAVVCPCYSVLVRWLGGSFAFFCLALALAKNANVLPNGLAISQILFLLSFDES
jgi:hypothetical protein